MRIPVDLVITCTACPVTIEGTVAGLEVYYRARHGRWGMDVGTSTDGTPNPELEGKCADGEELSISFAMKKIFTRTAVNDAINAAVDRDYEEAGG